MILVTGGTGLIGSQLLFDLTKSGKKVRALKRLSSDMKVVKRAFVSQPTMFEKIEWVNGDVIDVFSIEDAMQEVREVYHCAALVSFHSADFNKMMKTNAEGTANIVNAALEKGVTKFCMVSSTAALGRSAENQMVNEDTLWKKSKYNSGYAVSKYAAEREVWRGVEEGLNAVIVNPSIVLGAGDINSGSTALFGQVMKGLIFYPTGRTGFIDVKDVTKCMIELMEKNIFKERFIINSENLEYRDVINYIADAFGKKHPFIKVNTFLREAGWRAEAIRSVFSKHKAMITKETARNGQRSWLYSNEQIKKCLNINFIPIKESVERICEILQKEGGNN